MKEENKFYCDKCGFITYLNPAPTVSVIPIEKEMALIAIRGIEPFKGAYDLIGGFLQTGESVEEGGIRETKEETGLKIKMTEYVGSYSDTYGDDDEPTIGVVFTAKILSGKPEAADDVAKLIWIPIKDIPKLKFNGFKNTKEALMDLYKFFCRGAEN